MASFDYPLPEQAIAQSPAEPRSAARLLIATHAQIRHTEVGGLPSELEPGDVLVLNETRVSPARIVLRKATGGAVELLLVEPAPRAAGEAGTAVVVEALVRRSRRVAAGTPLFLPENPSRPVAEVGEPCGEGGRRQVTLFESSVAEEHGVLALPPYIHRPLSDPERYQTVYGRRPGSVAAPTAGLHLTDAVLASCRARGVKIVTVDLAVGLDTFTPVRGDDPAEHKMHSERYAVPEATMAACSAARRVVAVGTTTVRALESAAASGELEGRTSLYIRGDYPFRVVDVLMTNFHLPRSSLLLLLDAFAGPRWRELYRVALEAGYRFLSFGDAMLVARARPSGDR
ncbi:MAG: tRNA preQ1(34) S-adenosylmethionine ribosyltransferase-isomerase QueA [Actinomycetota bacterium]|nr:tRNA preQ1(34) S-adenosylmethionine ribosyltransferase-isomerase QueA [Actinomycetota bacterium]